MNYTPEISDEFMELIQSQSAAPVDEEEMLQIGWETIGTVIDVSISFSFFIIILQHFNCSDDFCYYYCY
jgi:hypothetical protein